VTIDGFTVIHFEMLDVDDFRRRLLQDALQCTFALDQRRAAQIISIEIKQIKSEIDEAIRMLFRELAAQRLEVRQSGTTVHGRLAVYDQLMCG
jgi:hypothetical protein